MAGLYVHIPFCKQRCRYCDFFSTTLLERREEYVQAVLEEIRQRRDEAHEPIRTIYLGGGTPSLLTPEQIAAILQAIGTQDAIEITLEANPGDLKPEYLQTIRRAGINRLSIGIQSFQDPLLTLIGRRHNAAQAIEAVQMAQKAGFDNISIDLMYGLPTQTMDQWQADINQALLLNIQHLSCYCLSYEEGTPLTRSRDEGQITETDEETENAMYDTLCENLRKAGFVHYEVSNFALPGYEAKHNSSYWNNTPYIGIGAGAHSYIGRTRSWNPNDLSAYIQGIMAHDLQREQEILTDKDLFNEKIMLGLRTNKGISVNKTLSGLSRGQIERISREYREMVRLKQLEETSDGRLVATQEGLHVLNRVIENLMIE